MKDVVITQDFFPKVGGAHFWVYEVYKRWPNPVLLLTQDYGGQERLIFEQKQFDSLDHGSVQILRKDITINDINIFAPRCIRKFYEVVRYVKEICHDDPVIVHCLRAFPEGVAGIMFQVLRNRRSKVITYAHGEELLVSRTSRQLEFLAKFIYRHSYLVISNSKSTATLVNDLCAGAKVRVINPGVDTKLYNIPMGRRMEYRKRWGWPEDTVILVTIARMEPRKNHASVIRAVAELRKEGLPLAYVIGGDGEEKERLVELASELALGKWVRFTGRLSEEDKILTFAAADIHIMPSIQVDSMIEGFGIVFLEAAAARIPSIAGNVGGQSEAVLDGETGLVIDGTNVEEVSMAIRKLATDSTLRKLMGQKGHLWASKNDWSIVANKIYDLVYGK